MKMAARAKAKSHQQRQDPACYTEHKRGENVACRGLNMKNESTVRRSGLSSKGSAHPSSKTADTLAVGCVFLEEAAMEICNRCSFTRRNGRGHNVEHMRGSLVPGTGGFNHHRLKIDALLRTEAASVLVCSFEVGICSSSTDRFVHCLRKRLASQGKVECGRCPFQARYKDVSRAPAGQVDILAGVEAASPAVLFLDSSQPCQSRCAPHHGWYCGVEMRRVRSPPTEQIPAWCE